MINQLLSRTFILSNVKLGINFHNKAIVHSGSYYLTVFNTAFDGNSIKDNCKICFDKMKLVDYTTPVEYGAIVSGDTLTVKNNQMNTRDIYYIYEPEKEIFILFNSLLLAKEILTACGFEVIYSNDKIYENGSYFKHIKQLQYAEVLNVLNTDNRIRLTIDRGRDLLSETGVDATYTEEKAKEEFYKVLFNATQKLTAGYNEVSIPLSGGIDSGTIAYLLKQLNKNVTAYTVGTEWGNEYEDAKSTANHINVPIKEHFISRDEILREIPNIIAAFGFNRAGNVEISLVPQCLFRKIKEQNPDQEILFATGFGSDLLNAGIYKPFTTYEELRNEIITTLKNTRMSNEMYNNLFFNNNSMYDSIGVVHPFWEPEVIVESLRIPPEFKVKENKDKYFFRKMMESRLGVHNSWRKKWAAHHGTGIGFRLREALSKGDNLLSPEEYEAYFKNIHREIFYKNNFSILN